MSEFTSDVGSIARKKGMAVGAGVGMAAAGSVWSTAAASGTLFLANPAGLCVALVIGGAWLGWRTVKLFTDVIESEPVPSEQKNT